MGFLAKLKHIHAQLDISEAQYDLYVRLFEDCLSQARALPLCTLPRYN